MSFSKAYVRVALILLASSFMTTACTRSDSGKAAADAVGKAGQGVKVGLDNELLYFETDGRTDATTAGASGLSRNIRTHVVERFIATIIPTATRTAIVSDTFANVKTLITAA